MVIVHWVGQKGSKLQIIVIGEKYWSTSWLVESVNVFQVLDTCVLGLMLPLTAPLQWYGEWVHCDLWRRPLLLSCCLPEIPNCFTVEYSDRNNANYKQLLLCATSSSQCIMYSPQFNLPGIPLRLTLPLSPFSGWRNWDTERLSNLPQDSQLRTGTQAHAF